MRMMANVMEGEKVRLEVVCLENRHLRSLRCEEEGDRMLLDIMCLLFLPIFPEEFLELSTFHRLWEG